MGDLALGIDCSSTASKVVAWDRSGKAVGEGRRRWSRSACGRSTVSSGRRTGGRRPSSPSPIPWSSFLGGEAQAGAGAGVDETARR
jgi:hypothetical protein